MLKIQNLSATSFGNTLLKNIDLTILSGEIHAVTGPKHCGKSALAHVITGHPGIEIESGGVYFGRKKLNNMSTDSRIGLGIFISFQTPSDFEDHTTWSLFENFYDMKPSEIEDLKLRFISYADILDLGILHEEKELNARGMTLSQSKRNELIYMLISESKFIVIDEIDDGLDKEEMALVGSILHHYLKIKKRSALIISRNQEFLDIIQPTHSHVMANGEICASGGPELYKRIIDDEYPEFS